MWGIIVDLLLDDFQRSNVKLYFSGDRKCSVSSFGFGALKKLAGILQFPRLPVIFGDSRQKLKVRIILASKSLVPIQNMGANSLDSSWENSNEDAYCHILLSVLPGSIQVSSKFLVS